MMCVKELMNEMNERQGLNCDIAGFTSYADSCRWVTATWSSADIGRSRQYIATLCYYYSDVLFLICFAVYGKDLQNRYISRKLCPNRELAKPMSKADRV